MEKIKAAVSMELWPEQLKELESCCDVKILPWTATDILPTEEEIIEECSGCEAVLFYTDPVTERVIRELKEKGLKLIGCGRATPNNIDTKTAKELGIPVIHAPGRNAHSVAEYTVGMMLDICKRISFTYHGLWSGRFLADEKDIYDVPDKKDVIWRFKDRENPRSSYPWGIDVYGRTVGIVGLGHIGQNVAKVCSGMGMKVAAYDPFQPQEIFDAVCAKKYEDPIRMLRSCDFVSVHLSVTPETKGMINDQWFNAMREDSYFINSSRAAVVDQRSLIEALENKKIAFAAVDVMWDEPAPKNHPFFTMDNVLLTPHMAGISTDSKKWASEMIVEDLLNYIWKQPLLRVWKR